jgi:radical SAM superfamily enzyme YgiQ (UPF0313 family)
MELLLVQPPFVQLNTPYPAIAYLASFCRREGHAVRCLDLSIELFRAIFCSPGLTLLFSEAEKRLGGRASSFDGPTRKNVLRYLSNREGYVHSIDRIIGFLAGGDDAFAHELAAGRRVPWGHRSEGFLQANDGEIAAADAPLLASLIVEDVADFISFAVDPEFSLVRYAESKASSQPDFRVVQAAARESFLLSTFFRPLIAERLAGMSAPQLLCVTVPFPGTLPGALIFAEEARRIFGRSTRIAFGGGYVSTELRALRDPAIFGFTDYLCYDAGYGALHSILASLQAGRENLYKTIVAREGGAVFTAWGFDGADLAFFGSESSYTTRETEGASELRLQERVAIREVFPDYAGLDFSRYVRIVEGTNPMHALWSDAKWLKARLAYGCYWHRCAFCDTALEYIARFAPSSPEALFAHLLGQSKRTGQRGVHFVDEALPVPQLVRFSLENMRHGRPLSFWGNTRLEGRFTADSCALLAEGGLVGVSAGLEIATEAGLRVTGKGLVLADIVGSLAALKANGILVHVYLMYGWPGQSEREIVDAMEIVRQLFSERLVDSAFWHKFILTRHSPMYADWKAGRRPDLTVSEPAWTFGSNDLSFEGGQAYEKYGPSLDAALGAWMEQAEQRRPVTQWFGFRVARPSVPEDHIARLARAAGRALAAPPVGRGKKVTWLGGRLLLDGATPSGDVRLSWSYRNRLEHVELPAARARRLLVAVAGSHTMDDFLAAMDSDEGEPFAETKAFRTLRKCGLVAY